MNTEDKVIILEALIKRSLSGQSLDPMEGCRIIHKDWHKVSDYLEELVRKGLAKYDPSRRMIDGIHRYVINK